MTIKQVLKALKKAAKDPEWSLDGALMVQVKIDGETRHLIVTDVSEGGVSPLFPYLTAEDTDADPLSLVPSR